MASIGPVSLQIVMNTPSPGEAHITVGYEIKGTPQDIAARWSFRELVQLFHEGRQIEERGSEHPVPEGTVSDGVVMFTADAEGFVREPELKIPMSALLQGPSALNSGAIRARVSLTVIPPAPLSRESDTVHLNQPPTSQQ